MSNVLECQPDAGSVRAARLFVVDMLQEWRVDDLVDSAALLTSELATNALLHTRRPFSVAVHQAGSGVRVEVTDESEELPHVPTHMALSAPSGATGDVLGGDERAGDRLFSGLGMVDAVANAWGTNVIAGRGKVVWFELRSEGRHQDAGLRTLRRDHDETDDLTASLPPLTAEGLDARWLTLGRLLLVLVLLGLLGASVYAGLWAGGLLGEVWYGH